MDYSAHLRDGLLLSAAVLPYASDSRGLRKDVERGMLVKLRRGVFVPADTWLAADSREQHVLRVRAVLAIANRPAIVAGHSAAALWGMPIAGSWPTEVTLLEEWKGGGRSEPGVRKTAFNYASTSTTEVGGMTITSLASTALNIARQSSFRDSIGSVDWARWRKNPRALGQLELWEELEKTRSRSHHAHLARVIRFSTSLSDSFGESDVRVLIHFLGFEQPTLQMTVTDAQGQMESDFGWPSVAQIAEYDGKVKYTRSQFNHGDPAEVAWIEKKREDRLRRRGFGVVRLLTEHRSHPDRLERLLLEAGVPRLS